MLKFLLISVFLATVAFMNMSILVSPERHNILPINSTALESFPVLAKIKNILLTQKVVSLETLNLMALMGVAFDVAIALYLAFLVLKTVVGSALGILCSCWFYVLILVLVGAGGYLYTTTGFSHHSLHNIPYAGKIIKFVQSQNITDL